MAILSASLYANSIQVDLKKKRVYLLNNKGVVVDIMRCLGGRRTHPTPKGVFKILQKDRNHHSNSYPKKRIAQGKKGAKMKFFVRLTWHGVGFHAGSLRRKSHGCIHLGWKDAKKLYNFSKFSTKVEVR